MRENLGWWGFQKVQAPLARLEAGGQQTPHVIQGNVGWRNDCGRKEAQLKKTLKPGLIN